jgi:hypothetical protein
MMEVAKDATRRCDLGLVSILVSVCMQRKMLSSKLDVTEWERAPRYTATLVLV